MSLFSALFKKEVGPYVLGQLLGTGATSTVHLGEHKDSKKLVAIKMIKRSQKSRIHDSVFQREVNALKQLSHNNLLRLESIFRDDEHDCIVLEYASGGDLLTWIMSEGSFRGGEDSAHNNIILQYMHQLLDGVQFLHDSNFVHRDLKLENLMIDATGCLKIGDFGLSLLYEPAAQKGQMQGATGTLEYMAPEVLQGTSYDPQPADIWSIGVILFCMLSGNFPFADKRAIIAIDYEMPPYFTIPMRSLISSILQRDPKRRPSIQAIRDSELMRSVTPTTSLLEQFYTSLKLKRESEEAGLLQSPTQRFRRASLSVVFSRKVTDALASPTIHGSGRDVRLVCHDRLMSLMELLSAHSTSDSSTYTQDEVTMRRCCLRSINWADAASDPAMGLQMSLADELSRCSLDTSALPVEHRVYTFVNIYNLLFLFSCIMHKAHPSSMSAAELNDFFGRRHHCLSFEMVSLDDLLHGLLRNNKAPNRRWHFRPIFSAERMLQMQDMSCAPPILPHPPVEALLWVLSVESGCELHVFESVPGRPTMQVLTEQKLAEKCIVLGSCVSLPWQFKYYAKDFGDNEGERLMTLARLMGEKGDSLRKLVESGSFKTKVEPPPDGSVALYCHREIRRSTSLDKHRPTLVKSNSFRCSRSMSDPGVYDAMSSFSKSDSSVPEAAAPIDGVPSAPIDSAPAAPTVVPKSPDPKAPSRSTKSDICRVQ